MGLSTTLDRWGEVALSQCFTNHRDVVVEVPADDYRGMWVLSGDVLGDIDNSLGAVLHFLLFSRLDIAVEDLDSVSTDLQLRPA
jgi:hypothetical protein